MTKLTMLIKVIYNTMRTQGHLFSDNCENCQETVYCKFPVIEPSKLECKNCGWSGVILP